MNPMIHEEPDSRKQEREEADAPGETAAGSDAVPALEGEDDGAAGSGVPSAAEDLAAMRERWLRAEADLQNFRRRARRDQDEVERLAEERVMLELIAALDDLERALAAAQEERVPEAWLRGVELVAGRMRETLQRRGVTAMLPEGERFDPRFHEAMLEVDAPDGVEPGSIVQVVLKGYRRDDRPLRAARVVVARAPAGSGA